MLSFAGKHALVTGASRGIGAACATLFGKLGASVAVHYHVDRRAADEVVARIEATGSRAAAFASGFASFDAADVLVGKVEQTLGPLDIVVLNHGVWKRAPIDEMTEADYTDMMDANLRGVFGVASACARRMKRRGAGRMIFVSSTAGQRGEAEHAHYAATKGAVISMTKSLAAELAPHGILVNCVAPGWVATDMTRATLQDPDQRRKIMDAIPLRRVATPEEIAGPVAFLASELATFVTGEILNVNGGAVLVG
jgi:3-oxoacyl-[acyl-carrier protein] reductase